MNPDVLAGIPVEARARTAKGAEAFVRYYLDVYNDVMVHPRQNRLMPLSEPTCKSCIEFEKDANLYLKQQRRVESAPITVSLVAGADGRPESDTSYRVMAVAIEKARTVLDSAGHKVATTPSRSNTAIFELVWHRDWVVREVRRPSGGDS